MMNDIAFIKTMVLLTVYAIGILASMFVLRKVIVGITTRKYDRMKIKKIFKIVLFIVAFAVGGWLGAIFLADFEPLNMLAFFAICGVLGGVFHQIDICIDDA